MIETQVLPQRALEFIVQEPPVDFDEAHAEYIANGGQLDPDSFRFVMEFAPSPDIDFLLSHRTYNASNSQARSLERYTQVGLSGQEKQLYALLRNEMITGDLPDITGVRPQGMSDQRLMAEILRLTDPGKMDVFTRQFPNIFPNQ